MKSKEDLFKEKMPSSLRSRILNEANQHLEQNSKSHRQSLLGWVYGAVGVAAAGIAFVIFRQTTEGDSSQFELAQSAELFEDLQQDDDFELLADLELIEELDLADDFSEDA